MVDYNELRKKFPVKNPARKRKTAAIKAIAREYERKKAELEGLGAPVMKKGIVFYAVVIIGLLMLGGLVLSATGRGGRAPATVGEVMKCVYASLAKCYADAIRTLSEITGKTYTSINIVGGGCQDLYLNALTAEATGLEVFAGPVEGTAIGNLVVQMIAGGEFADLAAARKAIVRN